MRMKELTNFEVISEIKRHKDMLGFNNSYCALVFNEAFGVFVNFETTSKFKQLEYSMYKDLISYIGTCYMQIHGVAQLSAGEHSQSFIATFTSV